MTTRTLVVMRHAKSDWSIDVPDRQRPIGARGVRQAREAGGWLAEHVPGIDLVLTSPAQRARMTWQESRETYGEVPLTATDEHNYTLDEQDLLDVVREIDDSVVTALLVGHNPGLDALVRLLSGREVEMVTSALAILRFEGHWSNLGARTCVLIAHGRPPS